MTSAVWTLTPEHGDAEIGLLKHAGQGFSHAIPGRPHLLRDASSGDEAVLILEDISATLRYTFETIGPMAKPSSMANTLIKHHTHARRRAPGRIKDISAPTLKHWGVAGGARCFYTLRPDIAEDVTTELVIILVQGACTVTISVGFNHQNIDWTQWALFESAFLHRISWDGDLKDSTVWPESPFLEASVKGTLQHKCALLVEKFAAEVLALGGLHNTSETFKDFRRRLRVCVVDQRVPTHPLSSRARDGLQQFLLKRVNNPLLSRQLKEQLKKVKTAHDLRGVAILFEQVIDQVLRWRQGQR